MQSEEDRCGKRTKNKPKDIQTISETSILKYLSVGEMVDVVKETMPYIERVSKLTRNELCSMLESYTPQITEVVTSHKTRMNGRFRLLQYDGANSCFLDSLLTALFLSAPVRKRGWVESVLLRMDNPLVPKMRRIYTLMRLGWPQPVHETKRYRRRSHAFMATELRQTMQRTFPYGEWMMTQNDPNEVLELMGIPATDLRVELTLRDKTKRQERWPINTLVVEIETLKAYDGRGRPFNIKRVFPEAKLSTGVRVRVVDRPPALYIPVLRAFWNDMKREKKLHTPVIAPLTLNYHERAFLKLRALIIHNGRTTSSGHYTTVLRLGGKGPWVLYNDMEREVEVIGPTLADVWAWDDGYFSKNVAGIFYS